MQRKLWAVWVLSALTGCGSSGGGVYPDTPVWPWKDKASCSTPCTNESALAAYTDATAFCRGVHNFYESMGNRAGTTNVLLAWLGALSAGVISPVANGSAKTAWSGLGAATNTAQSSMEQNFSAALTANRLGKIAAAMDTGSQAYNSATTPASRAAAAVTMAGSCSKSASQADQKVLQALSANAGS
ncbi:hypothetical protein ACIPK7_00910 [Pseudomonas sp. NPDC086581]|uniref:hypothetical protein n=1 Tax=Pseudomonas sp. NPDC086581 TaxID=3364432 RepID=UPI0037FA6912